MLRAAAQLSCSSDALHEQAMMIHSAQGPDISLQRGYGVRLPQFS